jgi:glycosyl transferase family 25
MNNYFDPLNAYYDKIYVLTLPRLQERIGFIEKQLKGLHFEFFFGTDKQDTSIAELKKQGRYSPEQYREFYKKTAEMSLGMLCCAIGHADIYRSIINNGYGKTLILEDDAVALPDQLPLFTEITAALPRDWELLYLGYEKNELYGWKEKLKKKLYLAYPNHAQLHLTRSIYSHYYPRNLSRHIAIAGFHDCTHAYSLTLEGAKKLLSLQTPVAFNPDNLLAYAVCTGRVKGYICRPKLFNQLSAFTGNIASLTGH